MPQGLVNAYRDFAVYFAQNYTIAQNYYGQRLAYLALAVVLLVVLVRWLFVIHDRRATVLTILLLALLPAAVNVTDILNASTHIELRMAGALVLVVPL